MLLALDKAGFHYPETDRWVFRGVNLPICAGETVKVIGRNGSGKTTLLKAMSGLLSLNEGRLTVQPGVSIVYMNQFAGDMLAKDLTIDEQLRAATIPTRNYKDRSIELLATFGLGLQDRLTAFVGHLSGGERQIVALLCVVASGASILCLDEFTAALDESSVAAAEGILEHLQSHYALALVIVSHSGISFKIKRRMELVDGHLSEF